MKPFYYSCRDGKLIFSNALECVRSHPSVSDALDELAIADFLLVGHGLRQEATAYRDIARLAPGHALSWDAQHGLRIERWFDLPLEEPYRGRGLDDLLDEFRALLRLAVQDRLRGARAAVSMSGGLDSTSVAATAREVLAAGGAPCDLRAFTFVSPCLLAADDEDRYARVAADYLGIPLTVIQTETAFSAPFAANARNAPEPVDASAFDLLSGYGAGAEHAPQPVLTGQGGDVGFFHERDFATGYLRAGRWLALAQDAARHVRLLRRRPPLYLRTRLRRALGKARGAGARVAALAAARNCRAPRLARAFRGRASRAAAQRRGALGRAPPGDACRCGKHYSSSSIPPSPACRSSSAIPTSTCACSGSCCACRSCRGAWTRRCCASRCAERLPEAVRTRPKAPLPGFPEYEALRGRGVPDAERLLAVKGLQRFVDVEAPAPAGRAVC